MKRLLLLTLLLAGCGGQPIVKEKEILVTPPAWMLVPCPTSATPVRTFLDYKAAAETLRVERDYCAMRMDTLRWWVQEAGAP